SVVAAGEKFTRRMGIAGQTGSRSQVGLFYFKTSFHFIVPTELINFQTTVLKIIFREQLTPEILQLIQQQRFNFLIQGTRFLKYSNRGQVGVVNHIILTVEVLRYGVF